MYSSTATVNNTIVHQDILFKVQYFVFTTCPAADNAFLGGTLLKLGLQGPGVERDSGALSLTKARDRDSNLSFSQKSVTMHAQR